MNSAEQLVPLLRKVGLFAELTEAELGRMAEAGRVRDAPARTVLFEEGDEGDAFFAVVEGAVEISRGRSDGGVERLAVRRTGEGFGEMALLDRSARSATARTLEASRLLVLDREAFHQLLDLGSPAFRLLTSMSKALRSLDVRFTTEDGARSGEEMQRLNAVLRHGILPRAVPALDGYELAVGSEAPETGSGRSAWDTFSLAGARTGIALFHAQSDGLPPAHHIAVARSVLRTAARGSQDPGSCLREAADVLAETAIDGADPSIACTILVIDAAGIEWASAGRSPAVTAGGDASGEVLLSTAPPLGRPPSGKVVTRRIRLPAGGGLLVLSCGSRGLMKGAADLLASLDDTPTAEALSAVHRALRTARPDVEDSTALLLRRRTRAAHELGAEPDAEPGLRDPETESG